MRARRAHRPCAAAAAAALCALLLSCEKASGLSDLEFADDWPDAGEGGEGGAGGAGGDTNQGGQAGGPGAGGTAGSNAGGTGQGGSSGGSGGAAGGGGIYGVITSVSFNTTFILDGTRTQEDAYINAHTNAFQMGAAFQGHYGLTSKPIPPASTDTFTVAFHMPQSGQYKASVIVEQQSGSGSYVNPMIEMQFFTDVITTGTTKVGVSVGSKAAIVVVNYLTSDMCALAIAEGTLEVTTAVNTTSPDGGQLAFHGSNLPLYYVKETPYGDLSGQLGMATCDKE